MSRIGTDTATAIVQTDTLSLINKANSIVTACTGTNCNTSVTTRSTITRELSTLSQSQSTSTQQLLSIPPNSIIGRNIYESYLNLGATVAAVYNFQCGNTIQTNSTCVIDSTAVKTAQANLEALLIEPSQTAGSHALIIGMLAVLVFLFAVLFFIFFTIGLFEKAFS